MTAHLSRLTDPSSSAAAAEEITANGQRSSQKATILRVLRTNPDCTASELALMCSLNEVQIRKRLPDLEREGLAKPGVVRRGLNRAEQTWRAVTGEAI